MFASRILLLFRTNPLQRLSHACRTKFVQQLSQDEAGGQLDAGGRLDPPVA